MNLTLTRRGDYALRAAVFLAASWDDPGYRTLAHVSRAMAIPRSYTPQILGLLVRAGLVEARVGRGGGYRLARSPDSISLLAVVETAEGEMKPDRCPMRGFPCGWQGICALHPAWSRSTEAIRENLLGTSLRDVAGTSPAPEAGTLRVAAG
jgi:Rrf2 family iron-sulfur cluster assembly transcriptional regulator